MLAEETADIGDSQSIIIGLYVILFGAGEPYKLPTQADTAELILASCLSDPIARIPDPTIRIEMGAIPLQLPWTWRL